MKQDKFIKQDKLLSQWLAEEQAAHIHGWDFSHIYGRYREEDDLPWNYGQVVRKYLRSDYQILDIDTGGGEFLLSLGHPYCQTSATEAYPPNVSLCREILLPLGINFQESNGGGPLPFPDSMFDLILNRHGDYSPREIARLLKPGGFFLTEQVGAENDRDLVSLLFPKTPPLPFPKQYLSIAKEELENCGLMVSDAQEAFRPIRFWDVGALVWFARIIAWEFPDFSVETCLPGLLRAQELLEQNGVIKGTIHRYFLAAQKPELTMH